MTDHPPAYDTPTPFPAIDTPVECPFIPLVPTAPMTTTRSRSRIVRTVRTRFSAGGLPVPAEARFLKPVTRAALRRQWAAQASPVTLPR